MSVRAASAAAAAAAIALCAATVVGCSASPRDEPASSLGQTRSAVPAPTPATPTDDATPRAPKPTPSTPSTSGRIPPLSSAARAAGLVDVRTAVPDALIDLRYATAHNFVGVRLYPVAARCLVHASLAERLRVAARRLHAGGTTLVFWDCYRPHAVQVRMFALVPDPNWVARPGPYATSHEAALSVDVTLAATSTHTQCAAADRVQTHCLLDMGTRFDDFTAKAHAYATAGISSVAQANRARLREAMAAGGLTVYWGEWWHFDAPGASVHRPLLDVPLT